MDFFVTRFQYLAEFFFFRMINFWKLYIGLEQTKIRITGRTFDGFIILCTFSSAQKHEGMKKAQTEEFSF